MKGIRILKRILAVSVAALVIGVMIVLLVPMLEERLKVDVTFQEQPDATELPKPSEPEERLVTAVYLMEKDSRVIEEVYIEVFPVESNRIYYMKVPGDTRFTLSEGLYESLRTYASELPQQIIVSDMAEWFTDNYAMTACNRMLSELLGASVTHYVGTNEKSWESWLQSLKEEKNPQSFSDSFTDWMTASKGDLTTVERWVYFESYLQITKVAEETAPGTQSTKGYTVSTKQSGELLNQEMQE